MPKVYDLNRMRKTYPLIRKKPRLATLDDTNVETAIIDISDGDPKEYTFQNTYASVPVCVATSEQENVNVFITSVSTTKVTIEVSADPPENCNIHLQIYRDTTA
jgi:hypothetical protein